MMRSFTVSMAELYYDNHNTNSFGKQNSKVNMQAKSIYHSNGLLFKTQLSVPSQSEGLGTERFLPSSSFEDKNKAGEHDLKLIFERLSKLCKEILCYQSQKISYFNLTGNQALCSRRPQVICHKSLKIRKICIS